MASNESVGLLKVWEPQNPADATVDIVFIHGLGGDRKNTWTYTGSEAPENFWPEELLPEKCPTARIFSFGYNSQFAHFFFSKKTVPIGPTVDDHSTLLLQSLTDFRSETKSSERPIIFVAHSLGGIVCANALSRSYPTDEATKSITDHTYATMFLGTPFEGSNKAVPGKTVLCFASWLGVGTNTKDIEMLKQKSEKNADIKNNFLRLLKAADKAGKSIHVACYFETSPTYAWNEKDRKMNIPIGIIVEKESAVLPPMEPIPISANHSQMCKFAGDWASGYEAVSGRLARWIKELSTPSDRKTGLQSGVNVSGNVKYKNSSNYGGVTGGHIVGLTPHSTKVVGSKGAVGIAPSSNNNNRCTSLVDMIRPSIFTKRAVERARVTRKADKENG